jgi:hypothetical protein
MKLYNLFEEVILEGLITESVNTDQIINTIEGEYANNGKKFIRRIKVHYDGDDTKDKFGNVTRKGKGWRDIIVHAYGKLKNGGREAIRAYQVYGDSLRNQDEPSGWKLFRTDRITHWEPTNLKYWEPIEVAGQPTNLTGDDSMIGEVKVVDFTPKGRDTNDKISSDNRDIDPKADTYRYDNAEPTTDEPEVSDTEELNNEPTFDDTEEVGVGFDDEKIRAALDEPEIDYEEEEIEDEADEIKNY